MITFFEVTTKRESKTFMRTVRGDGGLVLNDVTHLVVLSKVRREWSLCGWEQSRV